MVLNVVFLILNQLLKNPDIYIFSTELLCFVGEIARGGGMASRVKSPSSGRVRISGETRKKGLPGCRLSREFLNRPRRVIISIAPEETMPEYTLAASICNLCPIPEVMPAASQPQYNK
jgi:hypothetical protein